MKKESIVFIYPTYVCSNNCNFCFIDPKLRKRSNDLSLKEIKDNIAYFEKKHLIKDLVLVGGDPLLHKEIIPLMDFLEDNYFRNSKIKKFVLCTEGLKCSSMKFVNYLAKFFTFNNLNLGSYIHISLNNFYLEDKFFKQRKQAILNLAKKKINTRFIIVFTKDNVKKIENISKFLTIIFDKYYSKLTHRSFLIELRLPFNLKGKKNELFVPCSDDFLKTLNESCDLFLKKNIPFTLRNIPLCYLEKNNLKILNKLNRTYKKSYVDEKVIRIDKHHQLKSAGIGTYSDKKWKVQKECSICDLKKECNGINKRVYIEKFKYPNLKPFTSK